MWGKRDAARTTAKINSGCTLKVLGKPFQTKTQKAQDSALVEKKKRKIGIKQERGNKRRKG
jgi:hypothetical protein